MTRAEKARRASPHAAVVVAGLAFGCAPRPQPPTQGLVAREVSLRFEGTCAHLACCSRYAVPVPDETGGAFACDAEASARCAGNQGTYAPGFTCDPMHFGRYRQPDDPPYLYCHDEERWLSLPDLEPEDCGRRLLVCHRGRRVTAVARDRSAPNLSGNRHYEGSLGLLRALGADPDERESIVSIYALHERDRIASDPHCVGGE